MEIKNFNDKKLTALQQEIINLLNKDYKTTDLETKLSIKNWKLIKEYYKLLIKNRAFLTETEYQLVLSEYLANCCFEKFPEGKIAIISDAHIASKFENLEYLKQAKTFFAKNNIKYLLDGGDVGDGMVEYAKAYATYEKQLDHILDIYNFGSIKHYILGGNHDAKYKVKNPDYDLLNLLEKNNPNIEAVGYYQAYFKLGKSTISFQHNSYYKKSFIGRDLSILGHSHYLSYKDSTVVIPTLSDSFPNIQNSSQPGFLILDYKQDNNCSVLEFTNYKTSLQGIEKGKTKKYYLR